MDTTEVGGGPYTPLRITYQFDPSLAPGSGASGSGERYTSYGPLDRTVIEISGQCVVVSGSGTEIIVFNNAGTTFVEDSYAVTAASPATTGKTLFGLDLDLVLFVLIDPDRTMFTDTSLPTNVQFAQDAEGQQTSILLADPASGRDKLLFSDFPFAQLLAYSPDEIMAGLSEKIGSLHLNPGISNSLTTTLSKVVGYSSGSSTKDRQKAKQELQRFINQVSGLQGNVIKDADANSLIGSASKWIDTMPACG